jgi:hypothetical protein
MTEHKNRKRLIRERQARTGESYTAARRHLTPSETDVVLAKLDVGHLTVRAVRARVSDELRGILAAGGTEVGEEIIEVRVGDSPRGQPVLGERPTMIPFDNSRALVFGLLPDCAVSAEAVSPDGERVPCIVAPGVWLVVLPDNQRGAELYPVLFQDRDGAPVNPDLPADFNREAIGAREVPCPACGSDGWDRVTAAWRGTGHLRNSRWGYDVYGPGRAFVCRVCGHEDRLGSPMGRAHRQLLPPRVELPEP